ALSHAVGPPAVMTHTATMLSSGLRIQCRFFFSGGRPSPGPPRPLRPPGPPGGRTLARPVAVPAGEGETGTAARPDERDQSYRCLGEPSVGGGDTGGATAARPTEARPTEARPAVARPAGEEGAAYGSGGYGSALWRPEAYEST